MTALHWAADRGDSAMAAELLRAKANVTSRTRIGAYTPLHIAARTGNPAVVRALLGAGSDVKATTTSGATALHLAAAAGNADVVKALLSKGADPNARESNWGQTPLIFAAEYGRAAAVQVLMKHGADASIHTRIDNLSDDAARDQAAEKKRRAVLVSFEPPARHDSAEADFKKAVETATSRDPRAAPPRPAGADSTSAQAGGQGAGGRGNQLPVREPRGPFTPEQIQAAIDSGRAVLTAATIPTDSVKEEVDTLNGGVQGYIKQVGSVGGLTALHHAVRQGNVDAAIALIDGGANINDTSLVDGTTPLLMAIINGQFDVAIRLVERGANPNLASASGMAPLYATINSQWAPRSRYPQPQAIQTQKTTHLELMDSAARQGRGGERADQEAAVVLRVQQLRQPELRSRDDRRDDAVLARDVRARSRGDEAVDRARRGPEARVDAARACGACCASGPAGAAADSGEKRVRASGCDSHA